MFERVIKVKELFVKIMKDGLYFAEQLRNKLDVMAEQLRTLSGMNDYESTLTPEQFGYLGKGKATQFIQKSIDVASENGGGIVILKQGEYVSGTLVLRSNVTLYIEEGSKLLGSTELKDYEEHIATRRTVMDTNMGMNQSLIFAEACENIAICGKGIIDGQGTQEHFPGKETVHGTPGRPFLMRIIDCHNVHIKDITLKNAACWMQNYLNCENVIIEGIYVENQANYNNDGIDIDGCRNVWIHHSFVSSGDDAMCFKSASQKNCERVLVEKCAFYSSCNALKIGTDTQGDFRNILIQNCKLSGMTENMRHIKKLCADSGISLEMVDGAILENVYIRNIEMAYCNSAFFMRLDNRGRVKPEDEKPTIGTIRNIVIENVKGNKCGPRGSYFLGIPEKCIENILLKDITIEQKATEQPVTKDGDFDEMYGCYPDAHMIRKVGDAPAYGLWVRHIKGLVLYSYKIIPDGTDKRPRIVAVKNVEFVEN
jgi:polygalacturonase